MLSIQHERKQTSHWKKRLKQKPDETMVAGSSPEIWLCWSTNVVAIFEIGRLACWPASFRCLLAALSRRWPCLCSLLFC